MPPYQNDASPVMRPSLSSPRPSRWAQTATPEKPHPARQPWPPSPAPAAGVQATSVLRESVASGAWITMLLAWLLIFNHFGRPFEKILVGYRIPAALCGTAIIVLILQGSFVGFIVTRIGRAVLAFMVWMVLVTPMSSWRGGSLTYVVWYLALNGALFLILAASAGSHFGIKKLFYIAAFSCVFHIVIGGNFDPSERLNLDGTFGNADDVALLAGFALPFVLFSASQLPHLLLRILVAVPAAGFLLYCIGLTGTRSAIIALACVLAVYLWRLNATQGMAILLLCAIAFVGMVVILPATVVSRFVTIVDSFNIEAARQQRMESEAMASVADRYDLMMDGIHMTLTHPVWGVGPGQYPHYRFMNFKYANGQPKRWFPSHNTFIQISSESGIPGIMLYLLFLGMIYKTIRNCYALCTPNSHANWKLGYQMTLCLEVSFVYFVVCAIFMTCDQHPHQFLTAGLAIAVERTLAVAVRSQTATASALAIQPRLAV